MSTWLTCKECKKSFEYQNDKDTAVLLEGLDDQLFTCGRCSDTVPPLSKPYVIDPETGEEVRETHRYRVPTPDVVLTGADPAIMKRLQSVNGFVLFS